MTWNTQSSLSFTQLDTQSIGSLGTKTWNLLATGNWDYAADLADSDNKLSLVILRASESSYLSQFVQFYSLEAAGTTNDPRLEIEYQTADPIPGAILLFGSGLLALAGWRKFRKN